MQERSETNRVEEFIEHIHKGHGDRFIVNMHALHNPHLLREVIHRSLSAPVPLHANRVDKHAQCAVNLRKTQGEKRTKQQEKQKATRDAAAKTARDKQIQKEHSDSEESDEEAPAVQVVQEVSRHSGRTMKRRRMEDALGASGSI